MSWKSFIDPSLKKVFEAKPDNKDAVLKLRSRFVRSLNTAKAQVASEVPTKGRKMYRKVNGVVAFSPVFNNSPFPLDGEETALVKAEEFPQFVEALIASVEAGEFDAQLNAQVSGANVPATKKTRNMGEQSRANIRVAAWRRGGKSDDVIREMLLSEGVATDVVTKALARKKS
jgi:hypothetical protein